MTPEKALFALELSPTLTPFPSIETVKKAYYKLALRFHPDKNKDPSAPVQFRKVADAYHYLMKYVTATGSSCNRSHASDGDGDSWTDSDGDASDDGDEGATAVPPPFLFILQRWIYTMFRDRSDAEKVFHWARTNLFSSAPSTSPSPAALSEPEPSSPVSATGMEIITAILKQCKEWMQTSPSPSPSPASATASASSAADTSVSPIATLIQRLLEKLNRSHETVFVVSVSIDDAMDGKVFKWCPANSPNSEPHCVPMWHLGYELVYEVETVPEPGPTATTRSYYDVVLCCELQPNQLKNGWVDEHNHLHLHHEVSMMDWLCLANARNTGIDGDSGGAGTNMEMATFVVPIGNLHSLHVPYSKLRLLSFQTIVLTQCGLPIVQTDPARMFDHSERANIYLSVSLVA